MYAKPTLRITAALALLAAVLAGCNTAQPMPTIEATVDAQPTFQVIQTQAAQTVVAELTLNAPPPTEVPPPTNTPVPTDTPVPTATEAPAQLPTVAPVLPTATTAATATATTVFIPWTATPTATSAAFSCAINEQSPATGADFKPGDDFDGRWVVRNTGTQTWRADTIDIKFISGEKFHSSPDLIDLERDVVTQGTYTIILDMKAPANDGRYTANWALVSGSSVICNLPLTIDVIP